MTECINCTMKSSEEYCPKCGNRMPPESTEIASPLASIVRKAMQSKAKGPVAEQRAKYEARMKNASDEILIVADLSGSMYESIGGLAVAKYEHLKIALADIRRSYSKVRVIIFNSACEEWNRTDLPMPNGCTDLGGALKFASRFKPRKTIIISDGLPDNEQEAQDAADKITGEVDTIYCGPDGHPAIQFLRSLAHSTGGVALNWDGYRTELASNIRGLLT
jgi:hypothetical protein